MQRNHIILRTIVLPHLAQSRPATNSSFGITGTTVAIVKAGFSSTTSKGKVSADIESRALPSDPIPIWGSTSAGGYDPPPRARGHDPPLPSSSFPLAESSRARTRAYLGLPYASNPDEKISRQAETAAMALQRILQAYQRPSLDPPDPPKLNEQPYPILSPTTSVKEAHQPTRVAAATTVIPSTSIKSTLPEIPPMIDRLLSSRLYRLAVFHILATPEYAANQRLVSTIVEELERGGAGKLARRLKRGWEVVHAASLADRSDPQTGKGKNRLWSDQKEGGRLPPNHWKIIKVPPTFSSSSSTETASTQTRRTALTAHYNAHLMYLLTRTSNPSAFQYPISAISLRTWPAPTPSLNQLRKLLNTISTLEKHRGFLPDRQTAMIIVKCWMRCAVGSCSSSRTSRAGDIDGDFRTYKDKEGRVRRSLKKPSESVFGAKEIRALFDIVSKAMVNCNNAAVTRLASGEERADGNEERHEIKDEEWKSFGKLVIRALKEKGDERGVRKVIEWMRERRRESLRS